MADLFGRTSRFRLYRYHAQTIQFTIPGSEVIDIPPERLISFSVEHNYEQLLFPVFRIAMSVEPSRYYKILSAKNDVQLYLRIDSFYSYLDDSEPSAYRQFINGNFRIIHDEGTGDMLSGQKSNENLSDYTARHKNDVNNLKDTEGATLTLHLFKTDMVDATRASVSGVLKDATVTDAIGYCLATSGMRNIIMAIPDNKNVYKEMMIPPMSLKEAISFIDTYWGIYQDGMMLYFGFKYGYLIPYNGQCKAYVSNDSTVHVLIPNSANTHTSATGMLAVGSSDDEISYVVGDYHTLDIDNRTITNNYINANTLDLIDTFDGSDSTTKSTAYSSTKENFATIQTNPTENEYLSAMYASIVGSRGNTITVRMNNIDASVLEPNKRYVVVFEDASNNQKNKGNYILSSVTSNFIREGTDFVVGVVAVLKREAKKQVSQNNVTSRVI